MTQHGYLIDENGRIVRAVPIPARFGNYPVSTPLDAAASRSRDTSVSESYGFVTSDVDIKNVGGNSLMLFVILRDGQVEELPEATQTVATDGVLICNDTQGERSQDIRASCGPGFRP